MRAASAYHPLLQLSEAVTLLLFPEVSRMLHALPVSRTPKELRGKYQAVINLSQVPDYPVLSLAPANFGVEIGASPTYDTLPRERWQESAPSDGSEGTRIGRGL